MLLLELGCKLSAIRQLSSSEHLGPCTFPSGSIKDTICLDDPHLAFNFRGTLREQMFACGFKLSDVKAFKLQLRFSKPLENSGSKLSFFLMTHNTMNEEQLVMPYS